MQEKESINYKELYEKENKRTREYIERLAILEDENRNLQFKLDRIKNNPLWKMTKPLRYVILHTLEIIRKIKGTGGIRGFVATINRKVKEKSLRRHFGTDSFPNQEERKQQENEDFLYKPKISILVPLYNTPTDFLKDMVNSVLNQTYGNWQLCLADGSDKNRESIRRYIEAIGDERISYKMLEKNLGISGNTNKCYEMAQGDYIALFDHDDILHPSVLYEYVKVINDVNADYIYCDETTFSGNSINNMITMHFKPDFAIDNLRANNYICHFSCFKKSLLEGEELFRSKYDGSQDHDMILRLTHKAEKVVHVPKLLYYWRSHPGSVAKDINAKGYAIAAAKGAVADSLYRDGFDNFKISSTKAFETIFRISYEIIGNPKVSIIIPNKDHKEDLEKLILSINEKSTYNNKEIIVVENNSTSKDIFDYYKLLADNGVRILEYKGEFNYSKINNYGVGVATGEYVLLLNNDTQVISVNWIEELLMYCQRSDVGAVGCKLLYPDRTIQHAGVVLGMGAHHTAGHSHYRVGYDNLGYMGRLCYAQNVTAVTAACLMVKRSDYLRVGGLDENYKIALNDVDFCLKLRREGLLNVFTPFAELFHFESASRGIDAEDAEKKERYEKECEYFRNKWYKELEQGDPYFNQNFSLKRSDFALKDGEN